MSLHVALTADPYLPVPPVGYGGTERVVDHVVRGLLAHGHRVTLIAHPGSRTPATQIPYGVPPHWGALPRLRELWQVGSALTRLWPTVDIVHSFGRLAAMLPILPIRRLPKIQTYEREIPWSGVRRASALAGESLLFTGCSTRLWGPSARCGRWATVYNPVDVTRYAAVTSITANAPLVFLGRVEAIKGTHNAIAIARAANRRLIVAGNASDRAYFDAEVAPHVAAGTVQYVGEVDDAQKNALLGGAAALLMPIEWEEPFGIVMIEAMACGTPVIGYRRGSVPEVVDHGVTGFVVDDLSAAVAAVAAVPQIDRQACRAAVERRFSRDVIVEAYLALYQRMLAGASGG